MPSRDIDPRFAIARTYEAIGTAGLDFKEFEAELNSCNSPNEAVKLCLKWREKAAAMN